ncbi:hypothetical protein ABT186_01760 [Streptomyces sp. NPDC001634]|uniref:hypothetical protein n=1 Tax=Streptomyces sp. NPDC001634 TaxID=3154390 RepID=UPI0033262CE0
MTRRARLIVDLEVDESTDPRDVVPVARLRIGDGLEGWAAVRRVRISGSVRDVDEDPS